MSLQMRPLAYQTMKTGLLQDSLFLLVRGPNYARLVNEWFGVEVSF